MISILSGQAAVLPEGMVIGHCSDADAATGCTVILCRKGAVGSIAVRGGAPASRETDLLAPDNMVQQIHAVVLSGGSAFGLDAASGVMRYLDEQGTGVPFGNAVVPIVSGLSLFDLDVGNAHRRPDADMGYTAASTATDNIRETGNIGAGVGASVGRFMGTGNAMKGGLGAASVYSGELLVTAVVAVNSLGNIYDRETNNYIAGALFEQDGRKVIVEPLEVLPQIFPAVLKERANTSIGAVLTNAVLTKSQAQRVASMAHDGFARSIIPAHTSFDGDALYTLSTNKVEAQPDVVGAFAALTVEHAVHNAVLSAEKAYGLSSARSLEGDNLQE